MGHNIPTIPEFYAGKNIFITGGTGFIGKVIIEKFLRSCPDLKAIYVLLRAKKGKTEEERVKAITDLPLFDVLRGENPSAFSKIKPISGDVSKLGLDISPSDRQTLIDNVHIFIHGAASVRFDDSLSDAVILNTRGTREACQLALDMKQIMLFFYISTTYCVTAYGNRIEEKLYPPIADWRKTIEIAEHGDQRVVNVLTQKYMGTMPNTYTFSKNLAEHVVNDMLGGKVPVVIGRPSIVISTVKDPVPGWLDNFNGPCGILVASGKGVMRTIYANEDTIADHVPVDIVVKGMIVSIWNHLVLVPPENRLEVSVFNGASNKFKPVTIKQIVSIGKDINWKYPIDGCVWYPDGKVTKCWYEYYLKVLFFQLLPSFILDGFIKLAGYEPILVKVQRKIYSATQALEYFIMQEWDFVNEKGWALEDKLLPSDVKDFGYDKYEVDEVEYFLESLIGAKKYLLHEKIEDNDKALAHLKRMWIIYIIYNILWYGALIWLIFFKIDIISIFARKYNDTLVYLTTE